jgi:hypothetical protein
MDNPLINEREDGIQVLDPEDVGPGPGFKRSVKKFLWSMDLMAGGNMLIITDVSSG